MYRETRFSPARSGSGIENGIGDLAYRRHLPDVMNANQVRPAEYGRRDGSRGAEQLAFVGGLGEK